LCAITQPLFLGFIKVTLTQFRHYTKGIERNTTYPIRRIFPSAHSSFIAPDSFYKSSKIPAAYSHFYSSIPVSLPGHFRTIAASFLPTKNAKSDNAKARITTTKYNHKHPQETTQ